MKKTKANLKFSALIALVMSFMLAITAFGIFQIAKTASATQADVGTLGYGADNKATVALTEKEPATLTVKDNVAAKMYYMYANVTEIAEIPGYNGGEDGEENPLPPEEVLYVDLQVKSSTMTWPLFLSYNEEMKNYIGVIYAEAGMNYTVTTYTAGYTFTVEFYLTDVAIGSFNEYYLSGLEMAMDKPVTVNLQNVTGKYMVVVEVYDEFDETISVNGTALTAEPSLWNGFTGVFDLTDVKSLTVSTTSEDTVAFSLSLREIATPDTLEMDKAVELPLWQAKKFEYTATVTGIYTLEVVKQYANSYIDVMLMDSATSLSGSYINLDAENGGYPISFVAGQKYYFQLTYTGTEYEEGVVTPEKAEFTLKLATWTAPTLEANYVYNVPVTNSASTATALKIAEELSGNYLVSLLILPMSAYTDKDFIVTLTYNGTPYTLNLANDFAVALELAKGEKTIKLVSNQDKTFTCGISVSEVFDTDLELGVAKAVNYSGREGRAYTLYELPAGTYAIDLIGSNGNVMVFDTSYNAVVGYGETNGIFTVANEVAEFVLIIENNSDTPVSFSILVTGNRNMMYIDETINITLNAEANSVTYYIDLSEGEYEVYIPDMPAGLTVYANGEVLSSNNTFTVETATTVTITFVYTGMEEINFMATVYNY